MKATSATKSLSRFVRFLFNANCVSQFNNSIDSSTLSKIGYQGFSSCCNMHLVSYRKRRYGYFELIEIWEK